MYLIISEFHIKTDIDTALKQSKHLLNKCVLICLLSICQLLNRRTSCFQSLHFSVWINLRCMHVSDRCLWLLCSLRGFWEIISINELSCCCSPCLNANRCHPCKAYKAYFVNHHKYMIAAHWREAHLIIHICNINISVNSKSNLS